MTCLETTFLVDMLRGRKNILEVGNELGGENFTIAAPSIKELWVGAILNNATEKQKNKINELIESYTVLPLDERSAKEAGEIEADLSKRGERIETEDVMIAAIAKTNGETLVTRDGRYAKINGLQIRKY